MPNIEPGIGFREVLVWPPLEDEECEALEGALRAALPDEAEHIEELQLASPLEGSYSQVLIPRSILDTTDTRTEGRRQLHWARGIATALNRKELRYGIQVWPGKKHSKYFIGLSQELSMEEKRICGTYDLRQRRGVTGSKTTGWRSLDKTVVNDDGSQTLEYTVHATNNDGRTMELLSSLVTNRVAPRLGELGGIVATNVMVSLDLEAIPSLFQLSETGS